MSPRDRRLLSDLRQMEELAERGIVSFRADGSPPELYHLLLSVPGLALGADGLVVRNIHRCELYLHRDYPRRPPVVTWNTPIFHPNLLPPDRNGGACIGSWSAAESLADLSMRLVDLVAFRSLNVHDALNGDAAAWATYHEVEPGASIEDLAELPLELEPLVALRGARQ